MTMTLFRPLCEMSKQDKAKLLFFLFPVERTGYLEYLAYQTQVLLDNPEALLLSWDGQFGSIPKWRTLANKCAGILSTNSK